MVRNIQPDGPVDFILIAQEPSRSCIPPGRPRDWAGVKSRGNRNFCDSIYDFIFHYCLRNYLCQDGQTYYLTDLSKGAMPVEKAKSAKSQRYKRWYPLLLEELNLVAEPGKTQVIAIGATVRDFLRRRDKRDEFGGIDWVVHYSRAANGDKAKKVEPHLSEFSKFSETLSFDDILTTADHVLRGAGYGEALLQEKLQELCEGSRLTNVRKKSHFCYKKRFEELRVSKGLIWKG